MAAIYCADVWCDDCARVIRKQICDDLWENRGEAICPDGTFVNTFETWDELFDHLDCMDERYYDSDEFPKYCDDDEESDCPQHCAAQDHCENAIELPDGDKIGYFFGNSLTIEGEDYVRKSDGEVADMWKEYYGLDDKPCDEDFTITPCGSLGSKSALGRVDGSFIGEFGSDEEAVLEAERVMEKEQVWSNIWIVSDHGNWTLYGE